jgi:hypothetical protein
MTYTAIQIENAKAAYNAFMVIRTVESYEPQYIGWAAAEQRCEYHNSIVSQVFAGNKEVEREWKLFFLNEEVKADRKAAESKAKMEANKAASADILAPVKAAKKLGEFGKWLNTSGNPYRSQHFSKKYTAEAVNAFMAR